MPSQPDATAQLSLRERKKAKTRRAIREHALRLFQERGYEATTIDAICAAAEVSQTTFFRYFPAKEDLVLTDEYDSLIVTAFRSQAPDLAPIAALRETMRTVFGQLSPEEDSQTRERIRLVLSTPALRSALFDSYSSIVALASRLMAERLGQSVDEFSLQIFAGAVVGVEMSALQIAANDPAADLFDVLDAALAKLEEGLPLH